MSSTERDVQAQLLAHAARQTKAAESIQQYVAIWFWLSIIGAAVVLLAMFLPLA